MIRLNGIIEKGLGGHSRLGIPGRREIDGAPEDWPERFAPGSLNVFVSAPPAIFAGRKGFRRLDSGIIPPAFVVPQQSIVNNGLHPKWLKPRRGMGQAWRATLRAGDRQVSVWVFRRIGSHMVHHLELISPETLRHKLNLSDGDPVEVVFHIRSDGRN